jgi:ubiquinone/menaquinone biosynthesis C-methylase UbiE
VFPKMKNETEHIKLNEIKWDRWASLLDGNGRLNRHLRRGQAGVISLLTLREGTTFLDMGCGTGWAVGEVAGLVSDNGTFYGIDLSAKMIARARENFKGRHNLYFIQSNAESIPIDDDFFDTIICTNSFHHYPNPGKALREMHRLLRKGGRLYILDPTADTWVMKVLDKIGKVVEPAHVKMYRTVEFRDMYAVAGLKYVATEAINRHEKIHIGEK